MVAALATPQHGCGVVGADKGLLDQQGHEVIGEDVAQAAGNEGEEQSEILSLDSSLERVFGPGATRLAKDLGINSDKKEEDTRSDTEISSDYELEQVNVSTPVRDQRKKRVRNNLNLEDLRNIQGIKDHGVSSEGEHSEEAVKEVKKPRLGKSSETREEDNKIEILEEEENVAENKTDDVEELTEEIVGDKKNTTSLKEEDKILGVHLNPHEDVPLEDPGPKITIEDGERGAAGATQ